MKKKYFRAIILTPTYASPIDTAQQIGQENKVK